MVAAERARRSRKDGRASREAPSPSFDPSSPVPKYFQLREILLDLIERELTVDALVPSERELATRYGVSRMTARQAVEHLVSEARLYRIQGKGTFVASPKIEMPLRLTSFTDDMRARGHEPGSRDLGRRIIPATAAVARELGLAPRAPVLMIERLRIADGIPMAVERSHLPAELVPGLIDQSLERRSLYAVLAESYGLVLDRGEQIIEAGLVDAVDAGLLELSPPSAVLHLQRRSFAGAVAVEYAVSTYRADRYQLHATLEMPRMQLVRESPRSQR